MRTTPLARSQSVSTHIRDFLHSHFFLESDAGAFGEEQSLVQAGVVDSTGVLELVSFLETEFGFHVQDHELVPSNLDTIAGLTAYVLRKQDHAT